jgi:hypothetical protein
MRKIRVLIFLQIDIYAKKGNYYEFLFLTKGGGSANKTFLYQKTKSLLNDKSLEEFIREKNYGFRNSSLSTLSFSFSYWWNFC